MNGGRESKSQGEKRIELYLVLLQMNVSSPTERNLHRFQKIIGRIHFSLLISIMYMDMEYGYMLMIAFSFLVICIVVCLLYGSVHRVQYLQKPEEGTECPGSDRWL